MSIRTYAYGVIRNVRLTCQEVVKQYPLIQQVWGYGIGPDHNNRRCVDYMVSKRGRGAITQRNLGESIARYHVAHKKRLGVRLIIWNRRIWRSYSKPGIPAGTWVRYYGKSPHTDHVHVEYNSKTYDPA